MALLSGAGAISAPGWGLVPKQPTIGGRPKLLAISKRGNTYLPAMPSLSKSDTPLGAWLRGMLARTHRNVALVALANKLARITWATLRCQRNFELGHVAMTGSAAPDAAAHDVCRKGNEDGLTVDRRFGNLIQKTAPRCRRFHEDRIARISILATGNTPVRPDTFAQTQSAATFKYQLANGAGHTF